MSKQLREFQSRKASLVKEARALTDRVAADGRDMTDEEVAAFDALRTRIDAASVSIDHESGGIGAAAPTTFSNEAAGQDGSFLVPPQFSENRLFKRYVCGPSGTDWPTRDGAWGSWGLTERTLGCRRPAA